MLSYTVDSDGDVEMSLLQPIFEAIPWDHAALIEWLREWERYTHENVVVTVKGCGRRKTVRNLFTYVLKKPVGDGIDADVLKAVRARCCSLKNEFVSDVTSLFHQKLKMDIPIDGCEARIFPYHDYFNDTTEDNGLQGLIGSDSIPQWLEEQNESSMSPIGRNFQSPILKAQIF
ncbi:hypothetical protein PHMEG_0005002 [Phytophthora megakarya]|uniref:Uncharacterized protein n=1 Tax=Phytophthora megakarya TaxID=4795 RepID=A0A225WSD9_9STRA|nr:hypothetical protein PHMEG_0005002 [Phytophthora megakarya]